MAYDDDILLEEDAAVKAFVGQYNPEHALMGRDHPLAVGPYDIAAYCMEHKVQQAEAMKNAKQAVMDVAADFEKTFGRKYGFFEEYCMEDAEICIVSYGITARVARNAIVAARKKGIKVGMIRPITLWPFPKAKLGEISDSAKAFSTKILRKAQETCGGAKSKI